MERIDDYRIRKFIRRVCKCVVFVVRYIVGDIKMVDGVLVVVDKDIDIERKVKCVFFGDNNIGKICLLL